MTNPPRSPRTKDGRRPIRPKAETPPPRRSPAPRAADPAARPVVLAAVAGAHGLKGEVRLKLFTADLSTYRDIHAGGRSLTLAALRGDVARFVEVTDRTAAEALRGTEQTVPRSALPPLADGEYYHADLLGLRCDMPDGTVVGHVAAIDNFGAGDVLEIERPDGGRFMVPMQPHAVPSFDGDRLVIDPAFVEA